MNGALYDWYVPGQANGQPGLSWGVLDQRPKEDQQLVVAGRRGLSRLCLAECLHSFADEVDRGQRTGCVDEVAAFEMKSTCCPSKAAAALRSFAEMIELGQGPL